MSNTCHIPKELVKQFLKFKVGKQIENTAFIMKINKETLEVELEEIIEEIPFDELADEVPAATPRFIAYSYKYTHNDGRVSYPLIFIFYCPPGIRPELNVMYASTKQNLSHELSIMKIFDIRNIDDFDEEWLKNKLAFFT
eukprot:TRINITY_DN197_c0_g1_i1.p1 TRINITY_DN197_c0_g1~~TRINITY_DN197_c0_g1_i1.p1  ORF type:complete len:140 (+),score=46.90 TRINITY_DN197_c0_g1_i1:71-490(+)